MTLNEFRSKKGKNLRITSHNKKINEILDDIQKTKKSVIYNASSIGPDGTVSWYQTTISPVLDENKNISMLIAIDSDITKLKLAEEKIGIQKEEIEKSRDELKKLNATKDKFFSIIAHDLKNPFHSIMGFSDLLIRSHDSIEKDKQIEFIQLIKDSSTSAYSLLENLLNWARTQTNRIQYTPGNIELNALIKENFQMMSLIAENKEISLFVPEKDSIKVYADFNMVNTVLRNLVSNAIKFTGKGGFVHIDAEVENERLFISVRDNGVGMSENDLAKLFELDTYHSTSGTIGEIGTGLGLLVCKDFIERHGGELTAFSKPGEGSTFRFSLPLSEEVIA
jgi:signal transduction histidine kinase